MNEELEKEAIKRVDAFINNFSQDIRSTLYDRLNQEDVKDFLYGLYIDSAEPREKRIVELENACDETQKLLDKQIEATYKLDKENAELRKVAEFQQSSNMSRHFENKKLKEGLAVGETFNKALNSMNKSLEEERDKYRDMVFDLQEENAELKSENQKWKDEWQEQVQKATDEGYARTLQTIQLTKAKELLKNLLSAYTSYADSFDDRDNEIVSEAEQFLNDSEVEK